MTAYDTDLGRNAANFQPLTPLSFLERAAAVYPDQTAIVHGARSWNYRQFYARARQLASALARRGVKRGDTVSVMLANTPAMVEAHYGVPMCGAVLNTLNTRLDAAILAFTLDHAETKVLIVDREFSKVMKEALARAKAKPLVIDYDDPEFTGAGERIGTLEYEELLSEGDPDFAWQMPRDEWDAISLNYTSGTTGDPKGVVYHHRGAYLLAMGNVLTCAMAQASGLSVDAADVSLQRLVLSLDAVDRRRHPRLPAGGARGADFRCHRDAQGNASLRCADRDVDAAQRRDAGEEAAAPCGAVRDRRRAAARSRAGGDEGCRLQRHASLWSYRDLRPGQHQRLASRMGRAFLGRAGGEEGAPGRALSGAGRARRARSGTRCSRCRATARRSAK